MLGALVMGGILPQLSWDACWPRNRIVQEGRPLKDTPESTAGALDLTPEQAPGAYLSPPYLFPRGPTLGFSLPFSRYQSWGKRLPFSIITQTRTLENNQCL